MSELPELPISYADPAPLLAAEPGAAPPYPIDEGFFDDDEPPPPLPPTPRPAQRRPSGRRRLASGPRAAK